MINRALSLINKAEVYCLSVVNLFVIRRKVSVNDDNVHQNRRLTHRQSRPRMVMEGDHRVIHQMMMVRRVTVVACKEKEEAGMLVGSEGATTVVGDKERMEGITRVAGWLSYRHP